MTSQGKAVSVTHDGRLLIVKHQDGYCLIEMIGSASELSIGDTILGQWDAGGTVVLRGNEIFDCRFQGSWVSLEEAVATARTQADER
ncbi:MAG TPA: hypothetical protein VFB68_11045 [Xanthobacteraceae bacterium]|nr:hypothetical protein [Xanthobacteraceae bacterium]